MYNRLHKSYLLCRIIHTSNSFFFTMKRINEMLTTAFIYESHAEKPYFLKKYNTTFHIQKYHRKKLLQKYIVTLDNKTRYNNLEVYLIKKIKKIMTHKTTLTVVPKIHAQLRASKTHQSIKLCNFKRLRGGQMNLVQDRTQLCLSKKASRHKNVESATPYRAHCFK